MPIHIDSDSNLTRLTPSKFRTIAYAVVDAAFNVHQRYGRLFGERTYAAELVDQCRREGLSQIETEVPIRVIHGSFEKLYYVDLLIEGGALFELKAAEAINSSHWNQTLNYLYLADLNRAKIISFRGDQVIHKFVSTRVTRANRLDYTVNTSRWRDLCNEDQMLFELVTSLLADWGSFLSISLYQEAVTHFFGGNDIVVRLLPVFRDGKQVSKQHVRLHGPQVAFAMTAFSERLDVVEFHVRRFMKPLKLKGIQWINIFRHDIQFVTLAEDDRQ